MKKILLLMLCVALVLAGCAGQSAPASSAPQSAAPAPASSADSAPSSEAPAAPQTPDYPTKPVETMVQWAAGGGGDLVFRSLAEVFSTHANGQPMVIKNVDGASGVVDISEFLTATPDGYNIMHWNNAQVIRAHMTKVPYTL